MKVVQTFSAPMHLVLRMDEEISGHRQKSAYICDAIEKKMNMDSKCMILMNHSSLEILQAARYLCQRADKGTLSTLLTEFIESIQDAS